MSDTLTARLHRLRDAATLLERHGLATDPDADGADTGQDRIRAGADASPVGIEALIDRATARMRHGTDHTVAAFVGSTGSGKSSLLNAVAGQQVARTGVTRPTTAIAQAVTFGPTADGLLDDLGVSRRHNLGEDDPVLTGLVLLDLPDFDSVTTAHRDEVDRLIALVDLMIWVTDPQKYADEALHVGYLQPLATHADVMQVVLNKADLLDGDALRACLTDLGRLLVADGLDGVDPVAVSATAPGGVDPLRGLLAAEVAARQAAGERLHADVDAAVASLRRRVRAPGAVDLARVHDRLADDLAGAAGVPTVAALVAEQHRRDAALVTGWPVIRWVRRLRRAPLSRLSTTSGSQVARAEVSRSLRRAGADVGEQVGRPWADAVQVVAREAVDPVTTALDTGISRDVQVLRQPPRWWHAVSLVQSLLATVAVVGAVWLIGLVVAGSFLLLDVEPLAVRVGTVPLPTLLVAVGLGGGLILALLAGAAARVGGRRRARQTADRLRQRVAEVADDVVVDHMRTVVADATATVELLDEAARR